MSRERVIREVTPKPTPKKGAGELKGARFKSFFGFEPSDELIQKRVDKINSVLDELANALRAIVEKRGDADALIYLHSSLAQDVQQVQGGKNKNSVKRDLLGAIKRRAAEALKEVAENGPALIEAGRVKREKERLRLENERLRQEENQRLTQSILTLKLQISDVLGKVEGAYRKYGAEDGFFANTCKQRRKDVEEAERESDLAKAESTLKNCWKASEALWTRQVQPWTVTEELTRERKQTFKFYFDKLDTAVKGLPESGLEESAQQQANALRLGFTGLEQKKQEIEDGFARGGPDAWLVLIDKASQLYESTRRMELVRQLSSDKQERNETLDLLADGLNGKEDLESQATMRAAIALRFNIEFATSEEFDNPLGTGIKKLGPLYEVLSLVPQSHLAAGQGIMQISYKEAEPGKDRPNKFALRDKTSEGGTKVSTIVMTLPTDGEKIKKKNAAGTETELEYFQSTALHEIGHAVDDSAGFMTTNRASAGYGQWQSSSEMEVRNKYVAALEQVVGNEHKAELEEFVDNALKDITVQKPAQQSDKFIGLVTHWDALEKTAKIIAGLREGKAIWYKGGAAAAAAADALGESRVYFEAYPGQWWSFALSERSASLAEYQWRAPGEWFAETYSLYYLKKLPESHPVATFCKSAGS